MMTAAALAFAPLASVAQTAVTGGPAGALPQATTGPAGAAPPQSGPAAEGSPGRVSPGTRPPLSRNGQDCTKTVCDRSNGG